MLKVHTENDVEEWNKDVFECDDESDDEVNLKKNAKQKKWIHRKFHVDQRLNL